VRSISNFQDLATAPHTAEASVKSVRVRFGVSRRKVHLQENRGKEVHFAQDARVGEGRIPATLPVAAHRAPRVSVVLRVRHGPLLHPLLPVLEVVPLVKCEVDEIPGPSRSARG
jgi:hypothetical protein